MVIYSRPSTQNINNQRLWITKANTLLHLINHQDDDDIIDKICLYAKDPYEANYQFLINKHEIVRLKHFKDPKPSLKTLMIMQNV